MITMGKLKNGVANYLDREVLPSINGWQKWVFGAGAIILVDRMENVIRSLENHPVVKMMNIVHGDNIDIDTIYGAIREQAAVSPAVFDIPTIGSFKMGVADIDTLYKMIMEA